MVMILINYYIIAEIFVVLKLIHLHKYVFIIILG
jgi:hypothetical protein